MTFSWGPKLYRENLNTSALPSCFTMTAPVENLLCAVQVFLTHTPSWKGELSCFQCGPRGSDFGLKCCPRVLGWGQFLTFCRLKLQENNNVANLLYFFVKFTQGVGILAQKFASQVGISVSKTVPTPE